MKTQVNKKQGAYSLQLPEFASGLRTALRDGYSLQSLRQDILAGLTIGTLAVPLSMALAIATGVPPQHGLYTAIIAGAIVALSGGSRFNVSGPTAAFVVILFPIVQQYGLGGLLLASLMAGIILLILGLARMGRLIQFVPYPVILGFTSGIALVIAVMQIPDFLGLSVDGAGEHFTENITRIFSSLGSIQAAEAGIGLLTLAVLLLWPRLRVPIPGPLVGLIVGTCAALAVSHWTGTDLETIASRFSWEIDGVSGQGIPPLAPSFKLPWYLPDANGDPLHVDFALIRALLGPAFAIAVLGAIESLLCAVVADGLTKTRHDPNAELIGQGLGNILTPFFGGITATAALARTATNIRSGARSPLAAVVHALVVLLAVTGFSGLLGLVPMASLAALLLVVAWNMSEARRFLHNLRTSLAGDVLILLTCFSLTVLFDMVLAVAVGIGLAAALFIRRMAQLTHGRQLDRSTIPQNLPELPVNTAVYDIDGPLFFAAAETALASLRLVDPKIRIIIVDMQDVPSMDGTAIMALQSLITDMQQTGVALILSGVPGRIIVKLRRAGIQKKAGSLSYSRNLSQAVRTAQLWQTKQSGSGF